MTFVALLESWINGLLGPRAREPLIGSLTWGQVVVALSVVVLALLLNALIATLLRRGLARQHPAATQTATHHHLLRAIGKPLHLFVWVCALYLVGIILLGALSSGAVLRDVRTILVRLLDLGLFALLFWLVFRLTRVLDARLETWAARSESKLDDLLFPLLGRSLRVLLPVLGIIFALPLLELPPAYEAVLGRASSILLIVAMAVIAFQAVNTFEVGLLGRFNMAAADNLRARKVYTQVKVIGKVVKVTVTVFAMATILMLFSEVRQLGASLLASAGVVGIVAGIAAQKTLANLLAGFQIALAQPIRQDDVVIVDGEWGRVEEISLTYVVVHIWDDRRLVLPLSYFIEKPFQNWTRTSAQLLGSVFVWVDYSFPVDEARRALERIVSASPKWDRRFWNLQVTDANERAVQLRVLATAADSSSAWDLRCEIREKFIAYIQAAHPQALPQLRTLRAQTPSGSAGSDSP
jgi:small-conductance mechanosensitive channel